MADSRFPRDAPLRDVLHALSQLGFEEVRRGDHISLRRDNGDGTVTPMTLPNHSALKGSTLQVAIRQAGCMREEFLSAYFGKE